MARKKRKSNPWTTTELRLLRTLHAVNRPALKDLVASFPRHSSKSVLSVASNMGLRKPPATNAWMQRAREHLAARGGIIEAYLGVVPEVVE